MTGAGALRVLRSTSAGPILSSLRAGWLFLFSVLMSAGLLFTMVFFVRVVCLARLRLFVLTLGRRF